MATRSLLDPPIGRSYFGINRVHSDLSSEVWVFYYYSDAHALTLDSYRRLTRPTKRHGWRFESGYDRLARSGEFNNMENPPLPEDVKRQARDEFTARLKVCMWKEVRP